VLLHFTAATVWVGGQLTLAGLVPGLRGLSPDAPGVVARRFNQIAWPAFGVLVATGVLNIIDLKPA
jgi:putative copper export protein